MKSNRLIKRLDWYIIKKFLGTYVFAIALIISIAVVFDFNEKMDKLMEHEAPWDKIIFEYYMNFIPYFSNLFSPLFVFIAVIFFTSKLAENRYEFQKNDAPLYDLCRHHCCGNIHDEFVHHSQR